jgi:hypothetical protein
MKIIIFVVFEVIYIVAYPPSNAWMHAARECVTALFGHEWPIFDNEIRQLVLY